MAAPKRFVVTWWDAFESSHQHTEADIPHAPLVVETEGVILRDDTAGISIAGERLPGENPISYRAVTFIPRPLIVNVQEIRLVQPRKKRPSHEIRPDPPGSSAE